MAFLNQFFCTTSSATLVRDRTETRKICFLPSVPCSHGRSAKTRSLSCSLLPTSHASPVDLSKRQNATMYRTVCNWKQKSIVTTTIDTSLGRPCTQDRGNNVAYFLCLKSQRERSCVTATSITTNCLKRAELRNQTASLQSENGPLSTGTDDL